MGGGQGFGSGGALHLSSDCIAATSSSRMRSWLVAQFNALFSSLSEYTECRLVERSTFDVPRHRLDVGCAKVVLECAEAIVRVSTMRCVTQCPAVTYRRPVLGLRRRWRPVEHGRWSRLWLRRYNAVISLTVISPDKQLLLHPVCHDLAFDESPISQADGLARHLAVICMAPRTVCRH